MSGKRPIHDEAFEPTLQLKRLAKEAALDLFSADFAAMMDDRDGLKHLRKEFCYPKKKELPSRTGKSSSIE